MRAEGAARKLSKRMGRASRSCWQRAHGHAAVIRKRSMTLSIAPARTALRGLMEDEDIGV
jgi:hypothetical protein